MNNIKKYKTLFVSDLHIGSTHCNVDAFLKFLKNNDFENIYLCGDIFDFFVIKTSFFWSESFNTVVQKILRKARSGVNIFYIPGNHDALIKKLHGLSFGNISILNKALYTTLSGKKLKIVHGDEFDVLYKGKQIIYITGSFLYSLVLFSDKIIRKIIPNFSCSFYFKRLIKNFFEKITNYHLILESSIIQEDCDGIISGHTHLADLKYNKNFIIGNCGCWMADTINTCIVEDYNKNLYLLSVNKNGETINEKILISDR